MLSRAVVLGLALVMVAGALVCAGLLSRTGGG